MIEFIVIVESDADAQIATKLAERVLVEKIDWLEYEQLQYHFQWSGLKENTEYSCWKDLKQIIVDSQKSLGFQLPKYLGHGKDGPLKIHGAAAIKVLNLVRFLQKTRQIQAILLIRDLDNQPERREGIEQARSEHIDRQPKLEIIIGMADRMREGWVLNGFIALNNNEQQILQTITTQLTFDPCKEAHKLRSNSKEIPDRIRNPKVVLEQLTGGDKYREQKCWEETPLELLRESGVNTGLTAYLDEIEQRLIPIFLKNG